MNGGVCANEGKVNEMAILDDSEIHDFWSAVVAAGYSKDEFDLKEVEDKPQTSEIYALRGKAVVRRNSTSVTRQYPAGHGTTWVMVFEAELRGGVYGPA
jgi:hypothetical protein